VWSNFALAATEDLSESVRCALERTTVARHCSSVAERCEPTRSADELARRAHDVAQLAGALSSVAVPVFVVPVSVVVGRWVVIGVLVGVVAVGRHTDGLVALEP
jgi:hypothetical protein